MISLFPHLHTSFPLYSLSLISLVVCVDVKHCVYLLIDAADSPFLVTAQVLTGARCTSLLACAGLAHLIGF